MKDRGMTLIELVVAMAIFAMVSVMGLQGVTGMMRMRDRLDTRAGDTAELSRALSLLRADLGAAVPLLFHPPGKVPPRSALVHDTGAGRLALSVAGQPDLSASGGPGFGRAQWRLDAASGTLFRSAWSHLTPSDLSAEGPEVAILTDVMSMGLRSYWDDIGWVEGSLPGDPASLVIDDAEGIEGTFVPTSAALPLAVEITLVTGQYGTITVTEALE